MGDSRGDVGIACDCGAFRAALTSFPKNTPGRLVCYCRDCQDFLSRIGRTDRLDEFGGTEIVPVYPAEIDFLRGAERLRCHRLSDSGLYRWRTSCCNSPIANTMARSPWVGLFHSVFRPEDFAASAKLGRVRSRIFGRDAKEGAPFRISRKTGIGDVLVVMPFVVKGKVLGKHEGSPFFERDRATPIRSPDDFDPGVDRDVVTRSR